MISVRNLSKNYPLGDHTFAALKNINLNIKAKEIFGIVGRSGAGKSTLIRCINGLEKPTSGSVLIEGYCLTTLSASELRDARKQMGMIFQHFNLLSTRTVRENIALPLEFCGIPKRKIHSRVDELLALVELENHQSQTPRQLSGGQKQRVAIARALATSPKILLCDEGTSSLDPQSTASILELLQNIRQELGLTIFLITHEMDVVKTICDRVAILDKGEIVEESSVIALFTNPQSNIGKDLVKATSRLSIPPAVKDLLKATATHSSGTILRIAYHGESASEPIISYLIQQYQIIINILQGYIETIQQKIVGVMIVEIIGNKENVEKSIDFLERNGLNVEILGYVQRDP